MNHTKNRALLGHLAALFTITVWGTTFISTKILLAGFQPVEILFFRFLIGFAVLAALPPHGQKLTSRRQELTFALAGACGICLYYLLENIALTFTLASNVGVIISVAPFFTAILAHLFLRSEQKLRLPFFIGFAAAMAGIACVSFQGQALALNPVGDLLAVAAAFVWALYSIFTKKIAGFGLPVVFSTRKTFFYGILCMTPALFLFDFQPDIARFAAPVYLFNILYLGLGASALCFVTWNFAVKELGAVKTSVYIYLVPIITVAASALILHEQLSALAGIGMVLTMAGLILSEYKPKRRTNNGSAK